MSAEEYYFDDFSPVGGKPGVEVYAHFNKGIPRAAPNSLTVMGGEFIGDGGSFPAASVSVLDNNPYSFFSITLPEDCQYGKYDFSISFITNEEVPRGIVLKSRNQLVVTGSSSDQPYLTRIYPAEISLDELNETLFTVRGTRLDNLNREVPMQLVPGDAKLNIIEEDEGTLKVKFTGVMPQRGLYLLKGTTKDGWLCHSVARLKIT